MAGLRILDAACGHGRVARELARRGALVTGVDISANLIEKANQDERLGEQRLRYLHADVAQAGLLGDAQFDMVTCNFGLSDIDDLDGAIAAIAAALRPGGCFVLVVRATLPPA